MPILSELAAIAAKVAADGATKGKGIVQKVQKTAAVLAATAVADKVEKKACDLGINKIGDLIRKVPFFTTAEEKIKKAFAEHPERNKVCFHFTDSVRDGVSFYDPDGNETFMIRSSKKNLRQIELYQGDRFLGRIEKHITININPFSDLQKYDAMIHNSNTIVRVNYSKVSMDDVPWEMKKISGGNYSVVKKNGEEAGRFYSLGSRNFVLDYDDTVNPAELILSFMAIKIRAEEVKRNHHHDFGGKGQPPFAGVIDFIDDLKDIF